MKPRPYGIVFFFGGGALAGLVVAAYVLGSHLVLPQSSLSTEVTAAVYRTLVAKWFLFGVFVGAGLMFCLIETWIWKNWRSWNKFCCEHHGRIYTAMMGGKKQ